MDERLQKILAQAGYGSRRSCEELIAAGRVRVDGRVAVLGDKAGPRSVITLDGKPIRRAEAYSYIALYKPRNVISSVDDPVGRRTVRELIPETTRLYPVGRLDWDSEGLVIMTNDGDLANRLSHPRYGHTKEYRVLVARRPDGDQLDAWRRGIVLEDGHKSAPAEVRVESTAGKGAWLRVVMREGRKRQIRETAGSIGLPVVRIVRVRISSLQLGGLKPGNWRHLSEDEVRRLKGEELEPARPPRSPARPRRAQKDRRDSPRAGASRPADSANRSNKRPYKRRAASSRSSREDTRTRT
jgi:23S rRNA pseudouridine2605 synthase